MRGTRKSDIQRRVSIETVATEKRSTRDIWINTCGSKHDQSAATAASHWALSPEGRTAYIHADLRDPAAILNDPVTRDVLDFTQPIALMLVAILHMIPDEEKPAEIVATLLDALPPGSYIVASHITGSTMRARLPGSAASRRRA